MFPGLQVRKWLNDIWKIRGGFERFPDHYGLTQATVHGGLRAALDARRGRDQVILLLVHFPATFERYQDWLESAAIDYEIAPARLSPERIKALAAEQMGRVFLALASALDESSLDRSWRVERQFNLSVLVLERHPWIELDRRIDQLCRIWPFMVRLGYYLSLEDPLLRAVLRPELIALLQQIGLNDQALVTSGVLTRRLDVVLGRLAKEGLASQIVADNSSDWLAEAQRRRALRDSATALGNLHHGSQRLDH